tara:strand:- start:59 stop:514 length:456 start_codon:yes stop_codon:yes gene_type:complete
MREYRKATRDDFKHIVKLGKLMHEESSYSHLEFSEDRLLFTVERNLEDLNSILYIAMEDSEPVGLYAGFVSKYFFSDELVANDVAWYVIPEKRGSQIALRLLDMFQLWAKDRGVSETRLGFTTDIKGEKFNSLMKKLGYDQVGYTYRLKGE